MDKWISYIFFFFYVMYEISKGIIHPLNYNNLMIITHTCIFQQGKSPSRQDINR